MLGGKVLGSQISSYRCLYHQPLWILSFEYFCKLTSRQHVLCLGKALEDAFSTERSIRREHSRSSLTMSLIVFGIADGSSQIFFVAWEERCMKENDAGSLEPRGNLERG